ncbi:hypothetical protein [Paraburkholderia azotifigens]|uniref:hypothetical protein n=1 Tax=Paraburkholderia azotifigens TaxID=2057004 RepID=UPI0038B6E360
MSTAYHRDFDRLCALLKERGPVAFSMRLAQITGHPKDAVLLSQLVYWTRHGRDVVASQGWIHKTREQWFEETGLSREEQENTRRRLRRLNLTQEWRGGRPARLYFRIQTGTLSTALSHVHRLEQPLHLSLDFMRRNEHTMRALFGPSIAFHRVLAEVTGSVNAALMLSRMIQLQRHTLDTDGQWFSLTASEWARDCGLKRRQLDNAKHKLHQLGLIEEFVSRERHRRVFSRVHPVRLLELLGPIVRRISAEVDVTTSIPMHGRSTSPPNGAAFVKTLDTGYCTLPLPAHEVAHSTVKTLERRYGVRASTAHHDASRISVQTLDTKNGGQPTLFHEGGRDSVKTLDKQNGGRAITVRDRITAQKAPTNFSQPEKLDGEKRTLQSVGFVHDSRRETYIANARAYTTTSTNTPTTTGHCGRAGGERLLRIGLAGGAISAVVVGQERHAVPERQRLREPDDRAESDNPVITFESSSLIWPSWVQAAERQPIAQHLAHVPLEDRQLMLDEMAAGHRQHSVKWPIAYIGSLVKRYQAGDFIPAKAHLERECRRRAAVRHVALQEREEQFASQVPPASSAETARHTLAALRDALHRQWGRSGGSRD